MKRIAITLILLLTATFLSAEMRERRGGPVEFLGLSAEQAAAWENAERAFHESNRPLFEQERTLEEQKEALLKSKADACTIGTQELQIFAVHEQLRTAHQALEQKLDALLTAEQRAKLASMRSGEMKRREGPPPPFGQRR